MDIQELRKLIINTRFYNGIGVLLGFILVITLLLGNLYTEGKYNKSVENPVQSNNLSILNNEEN